jgi:hypothetical protein
MFKCGGQKIAANLGRIEPVLDALLDYIERHQWRD